MTLERHHVSRRGPGAGRILEADVVVAGGGPVGLAVAVELSRRGVDCLVIEPRPDVSHARPRCKTVNVRSMEILRRWGLADELRQRVPLPVSFSQDIVFCTTLAGRELSRFTGVLGLCPEGERFPELGQQAPQYVLEEMLRDTVGERLITGARVTTVDQDGEGARVAFADGEGRLGEVRAQWAVGCDGPRSAVRDAIGATYVGRQASRPNFGMVFHAPGLSDHVSHGPAVQYWTVNSTSPGVIGPLDPREGIWWMISFGVSSEEGARRAGDLIAGAAGMPVRATVLSTDPWTAQMRLVDSLRRDRVFLAGDAAHLNPPFGGHGLNTGIGDAVDLGWKLAATLQGWGGPGLLDSYERERRPVQTTVIAAAEANSRVLASDLLTDDLDRDGPTGERARTAAAAAIQATKRAEFHALDLVLDLVHSDSPIVAEGGGDRLPHAWLPDGRSLYDVLSDGMTLLVLDGTGGDVGAVQAEDVGLAGAERLAAAAADRRVPLEVVHLPDPALGVRCGAGLVLVRPDQCVAWRGDRPPADPAGLLDHVRGGR